ACRAEIAPNLLDLLDLVVPEAVADDITHGDLAFPTREYPSATLFRHLRHRMTILPASQAPPALSIFGSGEAAAIALAQGRGSLLLINERRAAEYALQLGLGVVMIPAVVVRLHLGGIISRRAAHRKLDLVKGLTTARFVDEARQLIDAANLP